MEPFTQERLAEMYADGESFNQYIDQVRQSGGNPADSMNKAYDQAMIVMGVYRRKHGGGFTYMLLKGHEHCDRVVATGKAEPILVMSHALPSVREARMIASLYRDDPDMRWVYGTKDDGSRYLGLQ